MKDTAFTIIITTYNRAKLLPQAIQSVLNQTFSDFELLVIDNGSTDDTRSVVGQIKDPRLRYVLNPEPTNSCDAPRNLGIRMARGEWVSFLDDDDIWYPDRLQKVKDAFERNPEVSAVCHNAHIRIDGKVYGTLRLASMTSNTHERLLYEGRCLSPCTTTVKADLLKQLNGFNPARELEGIADYDLWLRMTRQGAEVRFIDDILGEYVVTGNNASMTDPTFTSRFASLIKRHIQDYENKSLFRLSLKGMQRMFILYYLAAQSFMKTGRYRTGLAYGLKAASLLTLKPTLSIIMMRNFLTRRIKNEP